jgi:hypothetical protein
MGINPNIEYRNPKQIQNLNIQFSKRYSLNFFVGAIFFEKGMSLPRNLRVPAQLFDSMRDYQTLSGGS